MTATTAGSPVDVVVSAEEWAARVIQPADFVADRSAFVDVRLPNSAGKASYSFIGPGVSQNPDQVVNLIEPHGFNIGAAAMAAGVVNNQHLHFTAEVFICTRGRWRMAVGERGEQKLDIGPGTVFSVPTWVFRGFENVGDDDGWLFTVLGGDETGGIIWAPDVLRRAAETGLFLRPDHTVVEAANGADVGDVIGPLDDELLATLDRYSDAELAARVVTSDDLAWSDQALLSTVLPGHDLALAPVIGYGLTEDRRQVAPIHNPHGFGLEWLRLGPGSSSGLHRHPATQAMLIVEGDLTITVNRDDESRPAIAEEGAVVSVPPGAWRDYANPGSTDALAVVVTGGDTRTTIEWDPALSAAAERAGWCRDAGGYLAPLAVTAPPGAAT